MSLPISNQASSVRPLAIELAETASLAVLTDAETRACEQRLFDGGVSPADLMEQAGQRVAALIAGQFPPQPVLVACGPGNNGGDGYVIARALAERGFAVRIAALGEPRSEAARLARARWTGPVEAMQGTPRPAGLLIDAVFGSGQRRPLATELAGWLRAAGAGGRTIAVDVPSGIATDSGAVTADLAGGLLTIAIGALKPCHLLPPAAALSSELMLAEVGLPIGDDHPVRLLAHRRLTPPDTRSNKYTRGKVVVIGGAMAGAAHLAAIAAQRSGAGYVELVLDDAPVAPPYALVRRAWSEDALDDARIGAVAIGTGLADDDDARARLTAVLSRDLPVVLDAGALGLVYATGFDALRGERAIRVLTPHAGEFVRLFGPIGDDPVHAARNAAARSRAIVVLKGAATIVAAPDGRVAIAPLASPWLASAGTGDVLTGIVATMLAQRDWHGFDAFTAVCQAVRLHARAADFAGIGMIADDLLAALPDVLAEG